MQAEELKQVGREAILAKRRGEKPCVTSAVPALGQDSFRLIGRHSILTARAANSATIQQREQRLQHHRAILALHMKADRTVTSFNSPG